MSAPTSAAASVPAIELSGVTRRMGHDFVLKGIDLEVAPGRTVVLRGGNGAGKTTLLKLLSTRLKPTSGTALLYGHDVLKEGDEVRKKVGLLSVLGSSYPLLTARENLILAADMSGAGREAITELLERVGLSAAADRYTREFSSGMKKRLGLARLLLEDPELWLLDEPYAALDDDGKGLVDREVLAAHARGRTVLMASHEGQRPSLRPDATIELAAGRLRAWEPTAP